MHGLNQLLLLWAMAFVTLATALVLLNIFCSLIGYGLELLGLVKETAIAGLASLVEATALWLLITFAPGAGLAMIIPALIVVSIYKVTHVESWNRFELILLLLFQLVTGAIGGCLVTGDFRTAAVVLIGLTVVLALVAVVAKSFDL
jgi:hypothetical protein